MSRDKELDELQRALSEPYIETPDTIQTEEGALCWLDMQRVCGPSCVAYNTDPAPEPAERCLALKNSMEQHVTHRRILKTLQDLQRGKPGLPVVKP